MSMRTTHNRAGRAVAGGLVTVFLFCLVALPASAGVNALRNAFNPRGYFVTLKNGGDSQWLRSTFITGFYRSGSGGQGGGGGGTGASEAKDELGHSNVQYSGEENGLDFIDAADVDTIWATFDHNPTPGKDFLIGYAKDEQAAQLQSIPDFVSCIGNPVRPGPTDPAGGAWWSIPVNLSLGEENEDGSRNALADGTVYEFAFLRGCRANNGTTCVLVPGEAPGTVRGLLTNPQTEEEKALYDAHKYDEYEFITSISPAGTSSDTNVDHTIESVPMRYRLQTYANLTSWTESDEHKAAEDFLASVTESDYASGKYVRENVESLRATLEALDEEAETTVKYELQKDAEWTILQMLEDLKAALEAGKQPRPVVNFDNYNASLENAKILYDSLKDQTGTAVGQYLPGPVNDLKQAIDHAESTINDQSTQVQVDAEEAALDNAVMDALDALVREDDEVIFVDDVTGIVVRASSRSLPSAARLVVREVVSGTTEYDEMVARVPSEPDAIAIYRILFYDGEDVVYPTMPVTVQIPLQDQFEETAPSVYYLDNADSQGVDMNAAAPEGYRIFDTEQLGTFVLAGQKQSEPEEPTTPEQPTSPEEPTSSNQEEPSSDNSQNNGQNNNQNNQNNNQNNGQNNNQNNNARPQNNSTTQPPTHTTTRTTTRTAATRTTRIIRSTHNTQNNQRTQNEMTRTSTLQTQAVQPTTMTTTTTAPTTAKDTSDLEQNANQHTLLYIALAIAAIGIGAAAIEFIKDQRENDNEDEDL